MEVAAARQSLDEQSRRWHTWHVAALPNAKKFPAFNDFVPIPDHAEKRRQTVDEQVAIARRWSTVVGPG